VVIWILAQRPHHLIAWDVFGYYLYLPQTFIHQDPGLIDLGPVNEAIAQYQSTPGFYQAAPGQNGAWVIMYSMGMALIYLPFFFIGHFLAFVFGYPMDGYSAPYEWMMLFGSVFYSILGIVLCRKIALRFFSENMSAFLLVLVAFGTNYFFLNLGMVAMSHIYLFVGYALFLLLLLKWYEHFRTRDLVLLALVWSIMSLSRPTEGLSLLIFLLWGIGSTYTFQSKLALFLKYKKQFLFASLVVFMVVFPQLLYWKTYAGEWIFNSYQNPGEGFEFLQPHTFEFLFSFRKGWFIYTPIMLLAVVGIYRLRKDLPDAFWAFAVYFPIVVYVLSCWTNWWYAASFGSRPVIQYYPLLLLPLGFLLQYWFSGKLWAKISISLVLLFFVVLNLFQTWQMLHFVMSEYRMTWAYYKAIFFKTTVPPNAADLLLLDRVEASQIKVFSDSSNYYPGKTIAYSGFESPTETKGGSYVSDTAYSGKYAYLITDKDAHAPAIKLPFSDFCKGEYAWIHITMMVKPLGDFEKLEAIPYACFLNSKDKAYKWESFDVKSDTSFRVGQWNKVSFDYLTPDVRTPNDNFCVSLWLAGGGPVLVDDFRAVAYIKKEN
jgi:hypothetical protein